MNLRGILEWRQNNPEADPNLYEMVQAMRYVAGNSLSKEEVDVFNELYKSNMYALERVCKDKGNILYKMMEELNSEVKAGRVPDEYYQSLAGVSLYIAQQRRDIEEGKRDRIEYGNKKEFFDLLNNVGQTIKKKVIDPNPLSYEGAKNAIETYDSMSEVKLIYEAMESYKATTKEDINPLYSFMPVDDMVKYADMRYLAKLSKEEAENYIDEVKRKYGDFVEDEYRNNVEVEEKGAAKKTSETVFPTPVEEKTKWWQVIKRMKNWREKIKQASKNGVEQSSGEKTTTGNYKPSIFEESLRGSVKGPAEQTKEYTGHNMTLPSRESTVR